MNDAEMLQYLGTNGLKWAEEFCKIGRDLGHNLDEGWVLGWMCNAIEAGRSAGYAKGTEDTINDYKRRS